MMFKQERAILYVSLTPNRLMQSEFAEPVGIGAIGVLRVCRASWRAERPFSTSWTRPSPEAVAMRLVCQLATDGRRGEGILVGGQVGIAHDLLGVQSVRGL